MFGEQGNALAERLADECDRQETDICPYVTDFALHSICGKLNIYTIFKFFVIGSRILHIMLAQKFVLL